ncbi:hypothetical protein C8F01DRAFT_1355329 [Mycena amicta]|nr:hypothetical protein C8F01DRAFT_1355329 [Mycena amicta]
MGSRSVLFLRQILGIWEISDAIICGPAIPANLLARLSPLVVRQPAIVLRSDGRGLDLRQGQAQAVEEIHPDMPTDAIVHGPAIPANFLARRSPLVVREPPLVLRGDGRGLGLRPGQAQAIRKAGTSADTKASPTRGPNKIPRLATTKTTSAAKAMMATTASWRRNLFPTPSAPSRLLMLVTGKWQTAQPVEEIHHKRPTDQAAPQVPWRIFRRLSVQERRPQRQQWRPERFQLNSFQNCLRAKMELKAVMNDIVQSAAEVSLLDRIGGFSLEEGLLPRMPEPPTSLGSPALETRRPSFQERLGAGQRRSLSPSDVAREDGPQRKKAKHHLVQQTENGKGQEGRKRKTRRGKPNAHNLARAYARKVAKDNIFSERRLTGPITTAAAGSSSINASHQTTSTTAAGFSVANACQARAQMSDDEVSLGEDYGE